MNTLTCVIEKKVFRGAWEHLGDFNKALGAIERAVLRLAVQTNLPDTATEDCISACFCYGEIIFHTV